MRVSTITKLLNITAATAVIFVALSFYLPTKIQAHDTGTEHAETPATTSQPAVASDWEYRTPKGGSLTVLTRRSLQLYDQDNNDLKLSEAQIVYAETNIVQSVGPRLLEIGEKVKIAKNLVEKYAKNSLELTPRQIAAWQVYAARANFDLKGLEPLNAPSTTDNQRTSSDQTQKDQQPNGGQKTDEAKKSRASWQAWLIGLSSLAIIYYLARGDRK